MAKEIRLCPAKINLFLEVLDKRPDGYHNIDSVMHTVGLYDTVSVETAPGTGRITLTCSDPALPADEHNLAWKAADRYLKSAGITDADLQIHIDKVIPVAAGMAGGSADGAGVLLAMDSIFHKIPWDELLMLGKSLGADLPFCMSGGCARTQGIGEIMTPLPGLTPEYTLVLAKGGEGVSTKEAYQSVDSVPGRISADAMAQCLSDRDISGVIDGLYNKFEAAVLPVRPMAAYAKEVMLRGGALNALMSGSGPSVFGIFADLDQAERVRDFLQDKGYQAFVAPPLP